MASTAGDPSAEGALRRGRILSSRLYLDGVPSSKAPVVYSPAYDIEFNGIEKQHPFDSAKWGRVRNFLVDARLLQNDRIVEPLEASEDDLLAVHSESYLSSLKSSAKVARIVEVPAVALLPNLLVQQKLLYPFRKQVGGSVLSAKLALERGWAINIGGGLHHCSAEEGGGFCAYADISLCIHFAFVRLNISRVMIIDLDAHQGNGHEKDFGSDGRVYTLDMYNSGIYPFTNAASALSSKLKRLRYSLKNWSRNFSNAKVYIANCNTVILHLDALEETRALYNPECNLRNVVKARLAALLRSRNMYWKSRYTENRIKFGDECTKFFHAMATISFRKNTITQLRNEQGIWIHDHEGKAGIIWNAFRNRMGVTEEPTMLYNLASLFTPHDDLSSLVEPVTHEEIDNIVRKMPVDKASGPDGFNGLFLKKCWHIIKGDFYNLCTSFFEGNVNLESVNTSFITLVPKHNNPESINDFRPISLLNSSLKLLTKILADRLQQVILQLIHRYQYDFIRTRTIQDCLSWSFEFIHQCHQSRREIVILKLKLDFEKAFDTVEHSAIISVMQHMGFLDIWLHWIRLIFSSGTSAVLLNGVPGKKFCCKRGVRQGDPLSPLLFVLAADLLQAIINKASTMGLLRKPIPQPGEDFPIIQYADDTLLILEAEARQLFFLKGVLQSFSESTGLKVNYWKSQIIPINVSPAKMNILANTFGCQIGSMPFTYLGLPMGTTKPRFEDLTPLMDRVERRLSACSSLLSYSRRLEMVKSAITPITTYVSCVIKLPKGVIDNIDRATKQCLWRGNSNQQRGGNLVAWPVVTIPKDKGGLGILNLRLQNDALLLKHLDKFYNKRDIPWVQLIWWKYYQDKVPHDAREVGSFWWKDILRLSNLFRGIARCAIGDGSTVLSWDDPWTDHLLSEQYPRLLSFSKDTRLSVKDVLNTEELEDLFHLPLSQAAFQDFEQLQELLSGLPMPESKTDNWYYIWGNNSYTSQRLYKLAFANSDAHPAFKWIWKAKCTPRIKFFAWLVLVDRLNTKDMLRRRHCSIEDDDLCVLCPLGAVEDLDHLFFSCTFARRCWQALQVQWDEQLSLLPRLAQARANSALPFFVDLVMIASWEIWKDHVAKKYIDQKVELDSGTKTEDYLEILDKALKVAESRFQPQLILYNAGTDILDGDPLGSLKVIPEGVITRDEKVFRFAKNQSIPLLMLTSGGYMKSGARVIADSIINLSNKNLIDIGTHCIEIE